MVFDNLKDYISPLESMGELKRIKTQVSPELEISAITFEVSKRKGPALLFERPKGFSIPVLTNLFGSEKRVNYLFGIQNINQIGDKVQELFAEVTPKGFMDKLKIAKKLLNLRHVIPKVIKDPPCQEKVVEDVNLYELPILKCWEKDAAPFITAPLVITKDPLTKTRNIGMYRMQVMAKDKTGMHWHIHKGGAVHLKSAKENKTLLDVAVAIGVDPITCYCATAPLLEGMDEFMLAGFLRQRPVPLAKCLTCDLEVPAHSQIVLEGFVDPNETEMEGPFGDHTGFYSPQEPYPVFHVRLITMRRDPLYHAIVVGDPSMEDTFLGKLTERLFLPIIKKQIPEIVDINLPPQGVFHNICFVSIDKRYPGHAHKVMHSIWGMGQLMFTKMILVFDKDVDVQNIDEVLFYLGANVDPSRDIVITKGPLDALDHSPDQTGFGGKLGIDCTKKLLGEGIKRPWPERVSIPFHVLENIKGIIKEALF